MKESFGGCLRRLRETEEIPLRKLAAVLDIDQSSLSKFERNERLPKEDLLPEISKYFRISLEELRAKYLIQKVLDQIMTERNPERILELASERLRYIKTKNYDQGKLKFEDV